MKKLLPALLATMIISIVPIKNYASDNGPGKPPAKKHFAITELTKHQWTIVEYKETIRDTVRNVTLIMTPCEKQSVLQYQQDNTYKITDKCSSKQDVKGQGKWSYKEGDNEISEQFSGGARIYKKIVSLDESMLRIEYEGEAKKKISITYLSEVGKQSDAMKDQFVDNSDPISIITSLIREDVNGQDKYFMVSLSDFVNGIETKSVSKRIVVAPLMDLTRPENSQGYDPKGVEQKLIEQGKKSGVDFIITGSLVTFRKVTGPDSKPLTHISYVIKVLNVKKGKEMRKYQFTWPGETKSEKDTKALMKGLAIAGAISSVAPRPGYYGYGGYYGRSYYWRGNSSLALAGVYQSTYAVNNAAYSLREYSAYSRAVNEGERRQYFESSLSVMQAVEMTAEDLKKFIEKRMD